MSEEPPSGSAGAPLAVERPDLLPLLPLLYMAWSDGALTPNELASLRTRCADLLSWLDRDARDALRPWLDPDAPPAPARLERLRQRIHEATATNGEQAIGAASLADLGMALVPDEGPAHDAWQRPEARTALDALEASLGLVGAEAVRSILREPALEPRDRRPLFDVSVLADYLSEPHASLRAEVLELLQTPEMRFRPPPPTDVYRSLVLEAVQHLADRGFGMLAFPSETGGQNDPAAAIAVFETLAYGDLSVLVKFGVQFGLFGGAILQLGSARHRELLAEVGSLALPGCFAMTEIDHGSNVRDIRTTATYDPATDELLVDTPDPGARKDWIGNAALHGRMAAVFAQLEVAGQIHGVHVVLVPIRDEAGTPLAGVTIEDCGEKVGLNGVDNGRLGFDDVRVPRANLLDRYAAITVEGEYQSPIPSKGRRFFTMLGALVAGRISIAAASVSVAKTALTIAVRYGERRRQFGPAGGGEVPVLDYLVHQRALLPRLAETYALHFAVRDLVALYVNADSGDRPRLEALAAGLKAVASRHAVDAVQAAREACGGMGYLAANRFGELRDDVDIFTTFEGANPVLLQLVARALLSRYEEEMGDLRVWDLVRHIADRGQIRVTEMNPLATRNTDHEHLRDPDFLESAFRYREERLLASVARRLGGMIREGTDSFDAMNACQDHLVSLARAHVERVLNERFSEAVARAPTPGLSEALRSLSALYALSRIEMDRGWFLEAGYLEPVKSRAIRHLVNELCREVREQATFLVDGFGIPDAVLDAPAGIASD